MSCTKLCASGSELCSLYVIYKLTREATFSRNNVNTLDKIALNVRLPRLFVSNESWIIWEHTNLSESQEETILSQHFSSLFVVLLGEFFPTVAASYLGADVTDLRAVTSEMSPLPTSQRYFCATAMDSYRSLFSHKLR